jgi:ergothioneine biosynthesis protein EgtB
MMTRPGVDEVYQYRKHVDEAIGKLLSASYPDEVRELLILGINHEQQHQELLLTDLKYTLALNPTSPVYEAGSNLVNDENETTGWLNISQGIYDIGHYSNDFAFDNESGRHKVFLHDFEISKSLITNGEFIEFMADGGYRNFQHWLDDGWSWVNEENITKPLYWFNKDGKWFYFTLAGLQPINTNAILSHVSYYEAAAFAAWKGHRLPTEFEWEVASSQLNWGKRWEWTGSAYLPYPGFKIATGAVGEYNGKFMINQMVLRGASVATATGHSRNTYRNFFQPQSQWQFSGIRLAR